MRKILKEKIRILLILIALFFGGSGAGAVSLWVGQSYTWDFGSSVMGSTYNLNVSVSGGYLSVTGSGFYRNITPTQYFSGTATVTAEWDYTLYYGGPKQHQRISVSVSCYENPVSIHPTSITLSPGETYQLSYSHAYNNQYVGAANAYFSGGNSSFSVTSGGLVTAKAPGDGYVNVYSKVASAANAPYCHVTVRDVAPTGASAPNVGILADESTDLKVNVSPSNATVKSTQWHVKSGADVVSISGSRLTGTRPGTAVIYCMVNGSVRSNDATVTVTEPKLTYSSATPAEGTTGISVFATPAVAYSHAISKGIAFGNIKLTGGGTVQGTVELSGREVRFLPSSPLSPLTRYTLSIPRNAVKNKWGSAAQGDVSVSFTTADLEKATVRMSPASGSYLTRADRVTLSATPSDARIYYTVDGRDPSASGTLYTGPVKIDGDVTFKAIAVRQGYKDSDIASAQYFKSQSEIEGYYPSDQSPWFNYAYACPHLMFSGGMEKSNNFRRIAFTAGDGEPVAGAAYLTRSMIVFVPDGPLRNSTTYTLEIPRDAVKTLNGEVFKGFKWSFTTPTMPVAVGMRGDEAVYVLDEAGSLKERGMHYDYFSSEDGSFTFTDKDELTEVSTYISAISTGYTHGRKIWRNKQASGLGVGLTFCGENGSAPCVPRVVRAGFQTSAVIADDNTLWMCGRNDFYQLGDGSGTTSKEFVKVAENVIDVALGNGFTLYVDSDNVLWGVGRNHKGQLGDGTLTDRRGPVRIMEGVERVFASVSGYFSACITTDHKLLTWGDNASGQLGREAGVYSHTPARAMDGVASASLGGAHILALTERHTLYAWGSGACGQIGKGTSRRVWPAIWFKDIADMSAGPNSSVLLALNGEITGWGRKSHCNFGSGEGNAEGFVVESGRQRSGIGKVWLTPSRFEALPESDFALAASPDPVWADYVAVEWSSDHPEVAEVEGNGIIHTHALGEANITVRFTDRYGTVKEAVSKVVCSGNPDNSGIASVTADHDSWTAKGLGLTVMIENADPGVTYSVYNIQGVAVAAGVADSGQLAFELRQPGVYVVHDGRKAVKVVCHM